MEMHSSDVIKLMLQYCQENDLSQTYRTLTMESGVSLDTLNHHSGGGVDDDDDDDMNVFFQNIENGRWDVILEKIEKLHFPVEPLEELYEHIVKELLELREWETAKLLLEQTPVLLHLRQTQGERYYNLYRMMQQGLENDGTGHGPSAGELYGQYGTKEQRRMTIAHALRKDLKMVEPSRLLHLIGLALRQKRAEGTLPADVRYDPFQSAQSDESARMLLSRGSAVDRNDRFVTQCVKTIKFGKSGFVESACFSPHGRWLATGSHDGFVELYDYENGKLDTSLAYQAEDKIMMHEDSVLAVCFSSDSEMIASGSSDGMIKIWHIQNGICLRKIVKAHNKGVSCIAFNQDNSQVVSGSIDGTVRIHGLQSGTCLKEFHGHQSFVHSVIYSHDASKVISGSSDGYVRVWNARTMACLHQFSPSLPKPEEDQTTTDSSVIRLANQQAAASRSIHSVHLSTAAKMKDHLIICNDSPTVFLTSIDGKVLKHFSALSSTKGEFECCTVSPRGQFVYAVSSDLTMYSFNSDGEEHLAHTISKIHKKHCRGIAHHPNRNIVATFSIDGRLKIWCP